MRVRMLKEAIIQSGAIQVTLQAGAATEISDHVAEGWIKAGLAMQDKSVDGAHETKRNLYWCKQCGCSHKIDSDIGKKHRGGA